MNRRILQLESELLRKTKLLAKMHFHGMPPSHTDQLEHDIELIEQELLDIHKRENRKEKST